MKVAWVAVALVLGTALWANIGCGDDTGSGGSGATGSSASGSESAGSGMGGTTTTGSSTGSSMGTTGASSSSGSMMGYADCGSCQSNTTGAYTKECTKEVAACQADAQCKALLTFSYDTCGYDGCCPIKKAMTDGIPAASLNLYKAVETCATCGTCKTLCASAGSDAFCTALLAANPNCP